MRINHKQLWEDTKDLWKEYNNEDKRGYEKLFNKIFPEQEKMEIHSMLVPTSNNLGDFQIEVDRYHSPVRTYFIFEKDIDTVIFELRKDPQIRKYTKLCFFIEENIRSRE